jgi:NAD(P)-dependent dehydrogenase (short-subunit alcohol dehydrogenase family)
MTNLFDLSPEIAVVIGATGVLGGALAEGLAGAGARVAILGRNAERGQARVASILRAGGNDPKVTVTADHPFSAISVDDWKANFDLNLVGGALLPCQEFGPAMAERQRGSIINIASVSAHLPLSRVVTYSAAKAAVLNLTQFLAREWAPHGLRVNSITPGFFPAEQNRRLLFNEDGSPTVRAQSILSHTPMARFGKSEELIGAAIFLASSRASGFVTGVDLRVDGGFLSQTI